jgi:hypothetical protein
MNTRLRRGSRSLLRSNRFFEAGVGIACRGRCVLLIHFFKNLLARGFGIETMLKRFAL